ncbi:MAG: hypothetical protein JXR48_01310, partial [Candidatus Delongbacteria bacterium]|nr:hypothetical protein [Candidatus Delongbacteria bacterium]
VYRFAKTVVNPEDPLTFKVYFVQSWVPKAVKWLFWIIVILIIYLIARKFFKKFLSPEEESDAETIHFDEKEFIKAELKAEEPDKKEEDNK